TWGEAIDVPEKATPCAPVPTAVETIATPGAVTSGLSIESPLRGPPEVNGARPVGSDLFVNPMGWPSAAVTAAPSAEDTPKNGMVTVKSSPVSGFWVIFPSNGGSPAALLIKRTAAAPAFSP